MGVFVVFSCMTPVGFYDGSFGDAFMCAAYRFL